MRFLSAARDAGWPVDLFYSGPEPEGLARLDNRFPMHSASSWSRLFAYLRLTLTLRRYRVILIYHHVDPILLALIAAFHGERAIDYMGEPLRPLWEEYVSGERTLASPGTMETSVRQLWGPQATFVLRNRRVFAIARSVLQWIDWASIRRLGLVLANSKFTSDALHRVYRLDRTPEVVYQGIPIDPAKDHPCADRSLVINVGAFLPMKDQATLLRAWSLLVREPLESPHELVLVGSGPELEKCRKLAESLRLERVRFVTHATPDELATLYSQSAVLVHCAIAEPFGMTPVEAAGFGVPSIVARSGGTGEFVQEGRAGWGFAPRDAGELARCLRSALLNPSTTLAAGQAAQRLARERFSIEQNVERLRGFVDSFQRNLLGGKLGRRGDPPRTGLADGS